MMPLCEVDFFFHHRMSHGQSTTWRSPSFSRSNMWLFSSSWNPSAHLAFFFELWRYPPSDVVLTPAISSITAGRLVEGGGVLFLPVQVQRTCPLPYCLLGVFNVSWLINVLPHRGKKNQKYNLTSNICFHWLVPGWSSTRKQTNQTCPCQLSVFTGWFKWTPRVNEYRKVKSLWSTPCLLASVAMGDETQVNTGKEGKSICLKSAGCVHWLVPVTAPRKRRKVKSV